MMVWERWNVDSFCIVRQITAGKCLPISRKNFQTLQFFTQIKQNGFVKSSSLLWKENLFQVLVAIPTPSGFFYEWRFEPSSHHERGQNGSTLQGINISHLGKWKIICKIPFLGDMLVPWRVLFSLWRSFWTSAPSSRIPTFMTTFAKDMWKPNCVSPNRPPNTASIESKIPDEFETIRLSRMSFPRHPASHIS